MNDSFLRAEGESGRITLCRGRMKMTGLPVSHGIGPHEFTASWLTELLSAAGHLETGHVARVSAELWREKKFSRLYKLNVKYSRTSALRSHFVLKISRSRSNG